MNEAENKAEEILLDYLMKTNVLRKEDAIQCALIHVNGKLKPTFIKGKRYDITLIEILFWQEVKTIIENK